MSWPLLLAQFASPHGEAGQGSIEELQAFMEDLAAHDAVFKQRVLQPIARSRKRPLLLVHAGWAHAACFPRPDSVLGANHAAWQAAFGTRVVLVHRDARWPKTNTDACPVCQQAWGGNDTALLSVSSLWRTPADRLACPLLAATAAAAKKRKRAAAGEKDDDNDHAEEDEGTGDDDDDGGSQRVKKLAADAAPAAPVTDASAPVDAGADISNETTAAAPAAAAAGAATAPLSPKKVRRYKRARIASDAAAPAPAAPVALRGSTSGIMASSRGAVVCNYRSTETWRALCRVFEMDGMYYGTHLARNAFEPARILTLTDDALARLARQDDWTSRFYGLVAMRMETILPDQWLFRASLVHTDTWRVNVHGSFYAFLVCRQRVNVELRRAEPVSPLTPLNNRAVVEMVCADPADIQGNPEVGVFSATGCFVIHVRDFDGTVTFRHQQPVASHDARRRVSYVCGAVTCLESDLCASGTSRNVAETIWTETTARQVARAWCRRDERLYQVQLACDHLRAEQERQRQPLPPMHPLGLTNTDDVRRWASWSDIDIGGSMIGSETDLTLVDRLVSSGALKWSFTNDQRGVRFFYQGQPPPLDDKGRAVTVIMRRRRIVEPNDHLYLQVDTTVVRVQLRETGTHLNDESRTPVLMFQLAPMHARVAEARHAALTEWNHAAAQWRALQQRHSPASETDTRRAADTLERIATDLWGEPVACFSLRDDLRCAPLYGGGKSPAGHKPAPPLSPVAVDGLLTGRIGWQIHLVRSPSAANVQ